MADYQIPEQDTFAVRGQSFTLSVLDAAFEFQDLAGEVALAGGTHRDYLGKVAAWVQRRFGAELTLGEADWLSDQLDLLQAQKKSERRAALLATVTSPSSTASTPSD